MSGGLIAERYLDANFCPKRERIMQVIMVVPLAGSKASFNEEATRREYCSAEVIPDYI